MFWLFAGPLTFAALYAWQLLVSPARRQHKAEAAEAAKPVPERREPRDMTRPYPKRVIVGPDDERLTTCPVCGMEDPLFLDGGPAQGSLMGWPAHATCVEWIGKWEPPAPPRPTPKYRYVGGQAIPAEPVWFGGTAVTVVAPAPTPLTESSSYEAQFAVLREQFSKGMISRDEYRAAVSLLAMSAAGPGLDAVFTGTQACECGMCFYGTTADTGRSMKVHHTSGQHAQRVAYNQSHPDG